MADIKLSRPATRHDDLTRTLAQPVASDDRVIGVDDAAPIAYEMIELLFFAYRDFVGDADQVLSDYGYGRAHHRVLHFVSRHPGLSVAELLDVLKITKQSLARVLKPMIDDGFVIQHAGQSDRRQRLLYVTEKGRNLALDLARIQTARINRALVGSGTDHEDAAKSVLKHMIDTHDRNTVEALISSGIDPRTVKPGGTDESI